MAAVRVLFVEDEASISDPLSELLRLEGYEVVVARTVAEGLDCARQAEPDVVLLDLVLPDGNGRDLCRTLRRQSDVPILMLTARGEVHDRIVGLEIGADDYIVKPFNGAEVIARVGAILRRVRRTVSPAGLRRFGDVTVDVDARIVCVAGAPVELSRKEFELLEALLKREGRVVRREDLMTEVWDENWWGSTRTLDVHIGTLRRKLRDGDGQPQCIQTVRGVGFRLRCSEEHPSA